MANENLSAGLEKGNGSEQARGVLVQLINTIRNRHSKMETEFQTLEAQVHNMLESVADHLGWKEIDWCPMPEVGASSGGDKATPEETISLQKHFLDIKDQLINILQKRLEKAQQDLNECQGKERVSGGVIMPSFDVDMIVTDGLVFHFQITTTRPG